MLIMILGVTPHPTPPHPLKNNEGRNGKNKKQNCSKLPELPRNLVEKDFQILSSPIMKKNQSYFKIFNNKSGLVGCGCL